MQSTPSPPMPGRPRAPDVRAMFDSIAPRYDLLNHVLSIEQDRLWRSRAAKRALDGLDPKRVLDLCCGTGDLALTMRKRAGAGVRIHAADFSGEMLRLAKAKGAGSPPLQVDALALPFRDATFDVITVAFGVRNWADRDLGFAEARRVIAPGGRFVVLEFSRPPDNWFGALYRWYSKHVLPRIGAWVSRSSSAYTYLPESVAAFLRPQELAHELEVAGFSAVRFETLAGGTVALHVAERGSRS